MCYNSWIHTCVDTHIEYNNFTEEIPLCPYPHPPNTKPFSNSNTHFTGIHHYMIKIMVTGTLRCHFLRTVHLGIQFPGIQFPQWAPLTSNNRTADFSHAHEHTVVHTQTYACTHTHTHTHTDPCVFESYLMLPVCNTYNEFLTPLSPPVLGVINFDFGPC